MAKKNKVKVSKAGILGAAIGAAVGVGAVALSNKKNQKIIKDKFNVLKKQGKKALTDLQDKSEKLKASGKAKVNKKFKAVRKDIKAKL